MIKSKYIIYSFFIFFIIISSILVFFTLNFKSTQPMDVVVVEIDKVPISYDKKQICKNNYECIFEVFNKEFNNEMHKLEIKLFQIKGEKYIFKKNTLIEIEEKNKYLDLFSTRLNNFFIEYLNKIENANIDMLSSLKSDFYRDEIFLSNFAIKDWAQNKDENVLIYVENEQGLYTIFDNLQRFFDAMFFLLIISIIYLMFIIFRKIN